MSEPHASEEEYVAFLQTQHTLWYSVSRRVFAALDRPGSALRCDLIVQVKEGWKRSSCHGRSASYEMRDKGDAVNVSCTRQYDGYNNLVVRWAKEGDAASVVDVLHARLLAMGAELRSDSRTPQPGRILSDAEGARIAADMIRSAMKTHLALAPGAPPVQLNARTLEATREKSNRGEMIYLGAAEESNRRINELALTMSFEEASRRWHDSAEWVRGSESLAIMYGTSREAGHYVAALRSDPVRKRCELRMYRAWTQRWFGGLRKKLGIWSQRRHSRIAWMLSFWVFGNGRFLDRASEHAGLWVLGWRRRRGMGNV